MTASNWFDLAWALVMVALFVSQLFAMRRDRKRAQALDREIAELERKFASEVRPRLVLIRGGRR